MAGTHGPGTPRAGGPEVETPALPRITRTVGSPAPRARGGVEELASGGLTWLHCVAPSLAEAELLATRFGWHPLDVEDVLSRRQRPKADSYDDGYLFAVLHFPVYDKTIQRMDAGELDVFLGPDYLVTLPAVELLPVTRLFRRCAEDEQLRARLFADGAGAVLYELLDDLLDYCFPVVDKIGHKLHQIEDDVFDGLAEEVVRDISNAKQEILRFRAIIGQPERDALSQLAESAERFVAAPRELHFDRLVSSAGRIADLLASYKEMVEGLEATNESVLTHKLNDVIRILTLFTALLLPLTLLATLAALDVAHNPLSHPPGGFFTLLAVALLVVGSMLAFFRRRSWI